MRIEARRGKRGTQSLSEEQVRWDGEGEGDYDRMSRLEKRVEVDRLCTQVSERDDDDKRLRRHRVRDSARRRDGRRSQCKCAVVYTHNVRL